MTSSIIKVRHCDVLHHIGCEVNPKLSDAWVLKNPRYSPPPRPRVLGSVLHVEAFCTCCIDRDTPIDCTTPATYRISCVCCVTKHHRVPAHPCTY